MVGIRRAEPRLVELGDYVVVDRGEYGFKLYGITGMDNDAVYSDVEAQMPGKKGTAPVKVDYKDAIIIKRIDNTCCLLGRNVEIVYSKKR